MCLAKVSRDCLVIFCGYFDGKWESKQIKTSNIKYKIEINRECLEMLVLLLCPVSTFDAFVHSKNQIIHFFHIFIWFLKTHLIHWWERFLLLLILFLYLFYFAVVVHIISFFFVLASCYWFTFYILVSIIIYNPFMYFG